MSADTPAYVISDKLNLIGAASAPTILEAALRYHALGLTVLPKRRGRKDSGLRNWQNLRPSEADLRHFYHTGKYDGVILRPGALSQNLVMLDCDGELVYTEFCRHFPALVDTYTEKSGSGRGYHLFFQVEHLPNPGKSKIACKGLFNTDDLGFEIFYDSSAVVVAPSVHPSGGRYTIHQPLAVLRVGDLDRVVAWAQALETPHSRERSRREADYQPKRQPRQTATAPDNPGLDWNTERALWWTSVVLPALDQAAPVVKGRGKYQYRHCPNPAHPDKDPSFRISTDKDTDGLPVCTCGVHNERDPRGLVATWVGAPAFMTWWKTERAPLFKRQQPQKAKKSVRRRFEKPAAAPANTIPVEHISDVLTPTEIAQHQTLLIQGATGSGKSTAVAAAVHTLPKGTPVTAIVQYRLLTSALYHLLENFHHYEQASRDYQAALGTVERLVTSLSSLARFNRQGGVVIIDEITGVLQFLANSLTFKGREALQAYRALVTLIQTATHLIGMDANLDDVTVRFIEALRPGTVTVRRFRTPSSRGKVTLLGSPFAGIHTIEKLLTHQRGQVVVGCSSEKKASEITDYFSPHYRVLKVTRDTSHTPPVQAASTHANVRSAYDLIVYDSSWGAGVDIAEPVYAQVCLFDRVPLAPEQAIQLFGRVRHAKRRYVAAPSESTGYPTPTAETLLTDKLKRERWTAQRLGMTPQDKDDMLALAHLWAQFEERRLRETALWLLYFVRRLQADGFDVVANNAGAPIVFAESWKQWQVDRADADFTFTLSATSQALADDVLDKLRLADQEITHDLKLQNVRWKINQARGDDAMTEQDRDLMDKRGRARLFHLRDWFRTTADIDGDDRQQAEAGIPIYQRRYSALDRVILSRLLSLAEHTGTPEQQLLSFIDSFREPTSAAAVTERYHVFKSDEALRLFKALGHYGNNAKTVTGLCRWLLRYFGLELISTRRRVESKLVTSYQIDAVTLNYRLSRARQAAAQHSQKQVIRNVYSSLKYTKVITSLRSTSADLPPEAGERWPAPERRQAERANLGQSVGARQP